MITNIMFLLLNIINFTDIYFTSKYPGPHTHYNCVNLSHKIYESFHGSGVISGLSFTDNNEFHLSDKETWYSEICIEFLDTKMIYVYQLRTFII